MKGTFCIFLLALICQVPLSHSASGQEVYTENFDESTFWAGGSAGSYTPKTYQNPVPPASDLFSSNEAVRESTNVITGYAWRLRNSGEPYFQYACENEVVEFTLSLAHWNVAIPISVVVEYSLNSGTSYNLLQELDESWWTGLGYGDKEYRSFSSGSLNITPLPGEMVVIRISSNGTERLLIDEFIVTYNNVSSGLEDPLFFGATAISENQIDLNFAPNNSNDDVVIAFNESGSFVNPSGPPPSVGQSFAGGTLFYSGVESPQSHGGLSPAQTLYYKAWSYDGSEYSTGLSGEATTFGTFEGLNAWINEFHYDNTGGDLDEFIEIAVKDAWSADPELITVSLYNGSTGEIYASAALNTFETGLTVHDFTYYYWLVPGIQNGAPEGIALDVDGALIPGQFISYEGSFYATEGPAAGLLSTDIGLEEPTSTPVGYSLQLAGTGMEYHHFNWEGPLENSPGAPNLNQEAGNFTTWNGNISNSWTEEGNWDKGLPAPGLHAYIPATDPAVNYSPSIDELVVIEHLILDEGTQLEIAATGALTVSGNLLNMGDISILSGMDGSGSFISSIAAQGKVEHFISPNRWHYVSSPISTLVSDVFEGLYLTQWNEPEESWDYIEELGVSLNGSMKGYNVWADETTTLLFDGILNAGEKSIEATNTPGTANPDNDPSGYNLVGNPYPSALDWDVDDGVGWTRTATHIDMALYYWTGTQYASYVKDGPNPGPNGGSNIIPPCQGFYVKCNEAVGSLSVTDDARIHASQPSYDADIKTVDYLTLKAVGNGYEDETAICLNEQASFGYDKFFDAFKLAGSDEAPQLYTLASDSSELSINAFPPGQSNISIPIGYLPGPTAGINELKIAAISGFESIPVYLSDHIEQVQVNLKENGGYKFFADPDDDLHRFSLLLYADDIPVPVITVTNQLPILIAGTGQVSVYAREAMTAEIVVTTPAGRQIAAATMIDNQVITIPIKDYNGICFVTFYSKKGIMVEKVLFLD